MGQRERRPKNSCPITMEEALRYKPWIRVSQEAIDRSLPNNDRVCPIATTVRLTHPGASCIHVNSETIRWRVGLFHYVFDTPPIAIKRIVMADKGTKALKRLKPFSFRLQNPSVKPVQTRQPYQPTRHYRKTGAHKSCTKKSAYRFGGVMTWYTTKKKKGKKAAA